MMGILSNYTLKADTEGVVDMSQNPSRESGQHMQIISNLTIIESIFT